MNRPHPFDLLRQALPTAWFSDLQAAQAQGSDPTDRMHFHGLGPVRQVLRQLIPGEADAAGTTIAEYETLLYAAYRFWSAGQHSLALGREAVERVLATDERAAGGADQRAPDSVPPPPPAVPHGACYLQLPETRFWARVTEGAAPEPLDGMFLVASAGDRDVTVLAVLGLRPERDGFSQVAITVPHADLARARDFVRRPLFAPVLEGGDRAGVKSLVSDAELLHLTYLALTEVAR